MPNNRYPIIAGETWPIIVVLFGCTIAALFVAGTLAFVISLLILITALYLFRDPYRVIPSNPLAVVSPVHGVVMLIEEATEVRRQATAVRVQIMMRIGDIYSLRSPIEGKVIEQWCSEPDRNEAHRHFDFYIQSDEGDDVVTAIRLKDIVRGFHVYLHSGERVGQGQRCGYLYFGGIIDVFIPVESRVHVEVGQYVQSGSTVLAQIIHSKAATAIQGRKTEDGRLKTEDG